MAYLRHTRTPPAPPSKRNRSRDSLTLQNLLGFTSNAKVVSPPPSPGLRIPGFLNQTKSDVSKLFEELQWHQRFRLQDTANYHIDRSKITADRSRYANVLPYDKNRVKLKAPMDGSDFINASHINLESRPHAVSPPGSAKKLANRLSSTERSLLSQSKYIATQGPRSSEYLHFWSMIMHESVGDVAVIVMLTKFHEGARDKCGAYLPTSLDRPTMKLHSGTRSRSRPGNGASRSSKKVEMEADTSGEEITDGDRVTLIESDFDAKSRCVVRRLELTIGNTVKTVWHYYFAGWPDFGKPDDEDRRALLELARQTALKAGNTALNPRFVHCSAGVGRTGTFIALDHLLQELALGKLDTLNPMSRPSSAAGLCPHSSPEGSDKGSIDGVFAFSKETTPEAKADVIYETVKKLRDQRMMMVMTEIQFSFLYEILREAYVEIYSARSVSIVGTGKGELKDSGTSSSIDVEMGEPSPKVSRTTGMPFIGMSETSDASDRSIAQGIAPAESGRTEKKAKRKSKLAQQAVEQDLDSSNEDDPYAMVDPHQFETTDPLRKA